MNGLDRRESIKVGSGMRIKDRVKFDRLTLMRMWLFEELWWSSGRAIVFDVATGRR